MSDELADAFDRAYRGADVRTGTYTGDGHDFCVRAGSTTILSTDFRLAATDSRFGFVFSRRGLYPEGASTWFLPRLVGLGRALDWMISGRVFGAEEALAAGLVTSLHEPDDVLPRA